VQRYALASVSFLPPHRHLAVAGRRDINLANIHAGFAMSVANECGTLNEGRALMRGTSLNTGYQMACAPTICFAAVGPGGSLPAPDL
jgi:hypothetical protein